MEEGEREITEIDNQHVNDKKKKKSRSIMKKIFVFQYNFVLQFIKLALYFIVASLIFGIFYRKNQIKIEQEKYFGEQKVAHTSQIRGLFPPISGVSTSLYGSWKVTFTNSFDQGIKKDAFSEYLLQFKLNDHLRVRKKNCSGDLIMKWSTYSFNIFIDEYNSQNSDQEMIIEPNPEDIACIRGNGVFFSSLKYSSIWSIYEGRIYFLIEKWIPQIRKNKLELLILEKQNLFQ